MNRNYERDLDLNLLRVFVLTAETGSVTAAASRLYLTQPAVSAALKRLAATVGAPLFVREGRRLTLSARGRHLLDSARPHLEALIGATLEPTAFDVRQSERIVRLGVADGAQAWLLPPLLRQLDRAAPRLRLIVSPVQFRSVGEALSSAAIDLAVTVADDLPAGTRRQPLYHGSFVCLFDPRHARLGARPSRERYLAHDHVIVSYNGDLRGIIEDQLGIQRRVRVSMPSFHSIGAVVEGSALIATVPMVVARQQLRRHPQLRSAPLPLSLRGATMELLWRSAVDDDEVIRRVRELVVKVSRKVAGAGARVDRPQPGYADGR